MKRFAVTVTSYAQPEPTDTTEHFFNRPSLDGWSPIGQTMDEDEYRRRFPNARAGVGLSSFEGLTKDETGVLLSQLIDTLREHGPTDHLAEVLYEHAETNLERLSIERHHDGFIVPTPDGPTIHVRRWAPEWDGQRERYFINWHSSSQSVCNVSFAKMGVIEGALEHGDIDEMFDVQLYGVHRDEANAKTQPAERTEQDHAYWQESCDKLTECVALMNVADRARYQGTNS